MRNKKILTCFIVLLIGLAIPSAVQSEGILIDGLIDDWKWISIVSGLDAPARAHDGPLGQIRFLKVNVDDDFIYILLGFEHARPFRPPEKQKKMIPGVWDDFSYVELDIDGDGRWDYRTRMTTGKRFGVNNLLLLSPAGEDDGGKIFLHPEGDKDYFPLGPRAFFSASGRMVEQRIPRDPLLLEEGVIYLRMRVNYRDTIKGSGQWVTEYYPASGEWIGLRLIAPDPAKEDERFRTPSRLLEPVMRRDQFLEIYTGKNRGLRGTYVYPHRLPGMAWDSSLEEEKNQADATPTGAVRSRILINPGNDSAAKMPKLNPGLGNPIFPTAPLSTIQPQSVPRVGQAESQARAPAKQPLPRVTLPADANPTPAEKPNSKPPAQKPPRDNPA